MRISPWMVLFGVAACGGGKTGAGGSGSNTPIALPLVYPPVRANTPAGLIADSQYAAATPAKTASILVRSAGVQQVARALGGDAINLATAVQERLYTAGPTEILRILDDVDGRTSTL